MTTVLLTGASGFIGRHIHARLSANGHEVRVVLRPGSESRLVVPVSRTEIIETQDLFTENEQWWKDACAGVDAIIHAAWYVEPATYLHAEENAACVAGSLVLAKGAASAGVKHVIGIGTCLEYRQSVEVLDVDAPTGPESFYAICKYGLRQMLEAWCDAHNIAFSWCRLFHLFGDGERPQRLVPHIRNHLAAGEVAKLSGAQKIRDFLDVEDAGAMIADVVDSHQTGTINVCSGKPMTIREMAESVAAEYGRLDLLQFAPDENGNVDAIVGRCNAIKARFEQ